ncbi:hypothetical protein F2Q69_00027835 [Brassica cretica]|uniref:Uncharacterized protein n=1 Tax=Brassica cretica TaxID=69181 RepID=A0A8S9S4U9_BRACR|nr:hypothetical protein F2Q69_00027835 [Brassica cretica]
MRRSKFSHPPTESPSISDQLFLASSNPFKPPVVHSISYHTCWTLHTALKKALHDDEYEELKESSWEFSSSSRSWDLIGLQGCPAVKLCLYPYGSGPDLHPKQGGISNSMLSDAVIPSHSAK